MRLLITSSRMPFALDAIRKLGERGHDVFACDSYAASPGSHSKYLTGHFTTASASGDPEGFAVDVERIAGENGIEVVLPMFEEVFYLAAEHARISAVTKLYAPPFQTLARVHDKGSFQELCDQLSIRTPRTVLAHSGDQLREAIGRFSRYFARAAFSRGGVGLLTNTGPLAGQLSPEDCHPTEANSWLVQEFVGGPMHCTYSALHDGRVASHMSYRAPRQWEHSIGIQFLSVDPFDTLGTVEQLGSELGWDGQMSLDFAVLGQILREPIKELPGSIHDLAKIPGTDRGWHDAMPRLYSFLALAHHEKLSLRQREQLFVAMAEGITWGGQSIPGLPPEDAAYLAKLTGEPAG